MKKTILFSLLAAMVALTVNVKADSSSENVVGYYAFTPVASKWIIVPVQFSSAIDSTPVPFPTLFSTVNLVDGDCLRIMTSMTPVYAAYTWNVSQQTGEGFWHSDVVYIDGVAQSSPPAETMMLGLGSVVWFRGSVTAPADRVIYMQGEALTTDKTIALAKGWNVLGNPSPTDPAVISVWTGAKTGQDKLRVQNTAGSTTDFTDYSRVKTGWMNSATGQIVSSITIPAGCGIWYYKGTDSTIGGIKFDSSVTK